MERLGQQSIAAGLALAFVVTVGWGVRRVFKQDRPAAFRSWRDYLGNAGLALGITSLILMGAFFVWAAAIGGIDQVTLLLLFFLYGGSLTAVLGLVSSLFGSGRARAIGIVTCLVMAVAWWFQLAIGNVALVGR